MNKEKLIYDAILKKAHEVNRTKRPVYGQGQYDMAYEILNMVEEIINTQPVNNNWIPCSERLPENKVNVLITKNTGIVSIGFCNANYNQWREEGYPLPSDYVIAWQPLPQPYKGE